MKRIFLIVLDSFGIGAMPDSESFGDAGVNTLAACAQSQKLHIPNMIAAGLGNINSSDVFYGDHVGVPEGLDSVYGLKKMGVMALEMEAAALYMNAARYGKRALCICTISDHVLKGVETTSEERQTAFTTMMKVALDVAVAMENK